MLATILSCVASTSFDAHQARKQRRRSTSASARRRHAISSLAGRAQRESRDQSAHVAWVPDTSRREFRHALGRHYARRRLRRCKASRSAVERRSGLPEAEISTTITSAVKRSRRSRRDALVERQGGGASTPWRASSPPAPRRCARACRYSSAHAPHHEGRGLAARRRRRSAPGGRCRSGAGSRSGRARTSAGRWRDRRGRRNPCPRSRRGSGSTWRRPPASSTRRPARSGQLAARLGLVRRLRHRPSRSPAARRCARAGSSSRARPRR